MLEERKQKAEEKIKYYNTILEEKEAELKKLTPQRVTRTQKNDLTENNKKIEKLKLVIHNLTNSISALNYRINKNFNIISKGDFKYNKEKKVFLLTEGKNKYFSSKHKRPVINKFLFYSATLRIQINLKF